MEDLFSSLLLIAVITAIATAIVSIAIMTVNQADTIGFISMATNVWELRAIIQDNILKYNPILRLLSYKTQLRIVYCVTLISPAYHCLPKTEKEIIKLVFKHSMDISKKYNLDRPFSLLKLEDGTLLEDFINQSKLDITKAELSGGDVSVSRTNVRVMSVIPDVIPTRDFSLEFRLPSRAGGGYLREVRVLDSVVPMEE